MASTGSTNGATYFLIAVFILLATIGSVLTITNEFIGRSGWMAVGYAVVTAIFVIISINILLLVSSAAAPVKE
ncbi:MAG: hypothetical protein K8I29_11295 [Alphaproteobacteria bacterium]|uniref:Uncharacterized protein n=1 Tax=Candidatus Nitrobium versatile TaxID=2884831 RepID=A0A953J917_9BACT|nr:hypothetical protein [Candidatus Nitrobium versatile]